jgi:hypothetical protein
MDDIQFGYKQKFLKKILVGRVCARRRDVETRRRWRSPFALFFLFLFLVACDKASTTSSLPQACELDVRRTLTVWQREQWVWRSIVSSLRAFLPCSFYTKKLLLLLLLFFLRFLFLWLCGFFQARAEAVGIPPRVAGMRGFLHV